MPDDQIRTPKDARSLPSLFGIDEAEGVDAHLAAPSTFFAVSSKNTDLSASMPNVAVPKLGVEIGVGLEHLLLA